MAEQNKIVAEYVAEVARLAKTGKTTEHSFRGALAALIDALAPGLKAVNEPKRTDCGAPDYIVQDRTGLAVFYVEAKDLGDVSSAAAETAAPPVNGQDARSPSSADAQERVPPIDIFDYIYGVLHSPAYRAKFKEFLKSDFPRIPYPKDAAEFARFRDAGRALRETHLMRDAAPPLSEPTARFPVPGDNMVDAVRWDNDRVYINPTQYFDNVPLAAWEQAIGGYHPAEKWLKDRKGRALSPDDLRHYQRIILALAKTRVVMYGLG